MTYTELAARYEALVSAITTIAEELLTGDTEDIETAKRLTHAIKQAVAQ